MIYDYLVYIGRFQPFHNGHKHIVDNALTIAKSVMIICGTGELSAKNPWRYDEVKQMILGCYDPDSVSRLAIVTLPDVADDDKWLNSLLDIISRSAQGKIGIIGHHKDQSSYYLDLLPGFEYLEIKNYGNINATDIRGFLVCGDFEPIKALVPHCVYLLITNSFKN